MWLLDLATPVSTFASFFLTQAQASIHIRVITLSNVLMSRNRYTPPPLHQ
jgi:hypothetical protein